MSGSAPQWHFLRGAPEGDKQPDWRPWGVLRNIYKRGMLVEQSEAGKKQGV